MIGRKIPTKRIRKVGVMVNYLQKEGKGHPLLKFGMGKGCSDELAISNLKALKASNQTTLEQNRDQHTVLSLAPGEHLDLNQWRKIAQAYLKRNGLDKGMSVAGIHVGTKCEHLHIYTVNIDKKKHTKIVDKWKNNFKMGIRKFCEKVEKDYHLRKTGLGAWVDLQKSKTKTQTLNKSSSPEQFSYRRQFAQIETSIDQLMSNRGGVDNFNQEQKSKIKNNHNHHLRR